MNPASPSRRDFLTTAAATTAGLALHSGVSSGAYLGVDNVLKIGLIGCGGRGSGAAVQAMQADPQVRLTAMADLFADNLENSLTNLKKQPMITDKVAVADDKKFVGIDAFEKLMDSGVDVVLLTTPPHFRPAHLKAAIDRGLHCFVEKPVAVDAPGVKSVLATCAEAKRKNLSVVSGLCWRYDYGMRATFEQVHAGTAGDIVGLQCTYDTGGLWKKPRKPEWSDMEWQLRNWLYFTWLSGDFNTEQHVHSLDKMAWAMHDVPPISVTTTGGRQVRTSPEYGHVFDHFAATYEYANGVKMFARCRQQDGCFNDVSDHIFGTIGRVDVFKHRILDWKGKEIWKYDGPKPNMYNVEHNELFAAIRKGESINNGEYMCRSTMLAIMSRMSAYTGQKITWEQAMDSKEDLTPKSYEWGPVPVPPVAMPGLTPFV